MPRRDAKIAQTKILIIYSLDDFNLCKRPLEGDLETNSVLGLPAQVKGVTSQTWWVGYRITDSKVESEIWFKPTGAKILSFRLDKTLALADVEHGMRKSEGV